MRTLRRRIENIMNCYVRLIKTKRWEQAIDSIDELNGEAVTVDWGCGNNEWSVYECPDEVLDLKKCRQLDNIALKLICDNISKTKSGVELLILDKDFFDLIQLNAVSDNEDVLLCRHCNIREINLDKIHKAINYTLKNYKNKVIKYSVKDINKLFNSCSADYITEFVNRTRKDNLSIIRKSFNLKKDFFEVC